MISNFKTELINEHESLSPISKWDNFPKRFYEKNMANYNFKIPDGVMVYFELPSGYKEILKGGKYIFTE